MRQSLRRTLLWQVVGLLFYLGGLLLFLVVAVSAFLAPPGRSLANLTTGDVALLLVSVVLLVTGRVMSWKGGEKTGTMVGAISTIREQRPDQTKLEELGYQIPPDSSDDTDTSVIYEDGGLYRRCTECGAKNERSFDYCSNCSSRLPE